MGCSTYIEAIAPADEAWQRKAAAWKACEDAGIRQPDELRAFFGGEAPDPAGVVHVLASGADACEWYSKRACAQLYSEEEGSGVVIDLSKLPLGVKQIRVVTR